MDSNMSLTQEIRLTINRMNSQGQESIQKLRSYLTTWGKDAYILEIKYLVEDLVGRSDDSRPVVEMKKKYIDMIFYALFNQRPHTAVLIKTAFDMIDLPPGMNNYLQTFFEKCGTSNDIMIWICICTSSCTKQAIRQEAIQLIRTFRPFINREEASINPALYRELQEVYLRTTAWRGDNSQNPRQPMVQSIPKDSEFAVPLRIGRLLAELGCAVSSQAEMLRGVFTIAGDAVRSFDATSLLYLLLVVANKDYTLSTSASLPAETKDDIQSVLKQFPDLRSLQTTTMHWDVAKLAAAIKELLPSLDYDHLLFALDHPACVLKGVQSLRFIVTVAQELSGKPIPEDLVYQPWKNPDKQITFLTFLLESPEDLVDFAASRNQIVRVVERSDVQVSPAFFTGEVKSCWTSLDLLQVILQLQEQGDASALFRIRIKTAMDLTVLMVALVQLKTRWTDPRRKVMTWVLLQKTMSIVKRREQQLSLTSCMQLFFTTAPNETVECIVRAYHSSISNPANYAFFSTLFDACYTIPNFTNTLLKVPPSRGTLRFLVHVLFRDALVPGTHGAEMLRTHMDSLYKVCRDDLVVLLLELVDEYLENRLIVIDRPQLAKWTMDYLQYFMSAQSPQIKQKYMDSLQRLQIQGPMPVRVMPQVLFQNWFNLSSAAEKQLFLSDLMDIKSSPDGVAYIQSFIEEALKYLHSPTMLRQQDVMSLVELLVLLAKSKLITLDHLDEMILFVCNVCMSPSSSLKQAANALLEGLRPILKTTPNYLKELVSNPSVQQVPLVYQYLTRILSQTLSPVETELSLSASPTAETASQQDAKEQSTLRRLRDLVVAPIKPVRGGPIETVPEDRIKNRISVLINNVTVSNINNKVDDLLTLVGPQYETWFADYLVRSRCERQTNYHALYLDLVDRIVKVRGAHLMDEVLRISILVTNELLTSEEQLFMEQHAFLKNLGEWLGILTIGRDVCLSQLHLNLTNQLMIAFYHKRLHYVYEFVCFLLRAGKSSKVIRPPQPWLMALLSLLRELSEVPGIQNQICYLYSNYLNYMGYSPNDVALMDSYLFLAIPEVKNNRDFTDHASQEEVNMYFFKRYPKYMTESDLVPRGGDAKGPMRDYVAKATQGASPGYSPVSDPLGASVRDNPPFTMTLTKELSEVLSREQQLELHEMMEEDMARVVGTYQSSLGKYHYAAAISSVQAMYSRDLAQVKDVHEITEYLDRATRLLLGNLLYSVVPLMERELLVFLHRRDMDMRMMTDARLQALVKLNTPRMMTFTRNRMVTRLLNDVGAVIKEGPLHDATRFDPFPEMTENEKVTDGTLNAKQKAVFTKMAEPPSFSDALLSDKAMQEISVRFHYQQISSLVQSIFQHELSLSFLASHQTKEEDIIRDSLQKLSMCFRAIDGKHVLEEDVLLVSQLEDILRLPESINSLNVPGVIVRIAVLYNRVGLPQIKERLSAVVLERLQPQQYSLTYLPIITLLACNNLLEVALLDRCLQPMVASLVAAPTDVHRIVFSCLIDLVLVRELVGVDSIPLTMRALEEKAQTEAGRRSIRIDGTSYSCFDIVEKMHAKRNVLSCRKTLQAACETEAYRTWTEAVQEAIRAYNTPDNVFTNSSRFTDLIQALDTAVDSLGENAVFVALYGLLMSCYSVCLRVADVKEMAFRRDYVCTLLSAVLAELVNRETPRTNRLMVFGAELEAVEALLFQSHDLREPQFLPLFFLRVLIGLVKEVVLVQQTEVRNAMMLRFAMLMRTLAPPVVPDFLVSWIQLLSMPQILQLLLEEEVPELAQITGDMVIRLLSFMRYLSTKDLQMITQNLVDRITILLKILLTSFPGFLCSRASELVPLVKEDMRAYILNDCPPQCNPMLVRPEEREAFLKRAWEITVERNPVYKQELQRSMVKEAAENVLLGKNLEASLVTILRVNESRAAVILRPLLQFWVLDEEEVHAKVGNSGQTLASEDAILELLKVVNYNHEYEAVIFNILADYIRFPCKETKLFMKAYCGLYCIMDNESKKLMMDVMRRRLDGPNGKYGAHLTLQNMQKL